MKESASTQKDVALEEMTTATASEAREQARVKTMEKVEQLCELSRALAVLASASVRIGSNQISKGLSKSYNFYFMGDTLIGYHPIILMGALPIFSYTGETL